ncbi:uncharacterized protein LOC106662447 [Cimex lectularius]|uniref:Uncharacterized protein n=1 Tax=Cimex lectularius TaxID=79782 RepID=A0A8I6RBB7_CIMLE|nr:uncharacterized protein LOC106662447 [Cimex lectularius]
MVINENLKNYIKTFSKLLRNKKFYLYYNTSSSVILRNGELKLYKKVLQEKLKKRFNNLEVKIKQRGIKMNLVVFIKNVKKYEAEFLTLNTRRVKVILLCILKGNFDFVKIVQEAINFALNCIFKPFKPVQIYFKRILGDVLKDNILNKTNFEGISLDYAHPKISSCKIKATLPQPILNAATVKIFKQIQKSKEEKIESFFNSVTEHLTQTYGIDLHQFCITALTYSNHFIQLNSKNTFEMKAVSDNVPYTVISSVWELLTRKESM